MLNIYIGKNNLPSDKKFIYNPQALSVDLDLLKNDFVKHVLKEVEQATPQTKETYFDRFGRGLFNTTLSTSTVILLSLEQFPDLIINGDEMGDNAFEVLCTMDTGSIYFSDGIRELEEIPLPFILNGSIITSEEELWRV